MPVPEAPVVTVTKAALLAAVHAQVDAAVTGIVPVVAAALTLLVTLPSVTVHALDGVEVAAVSLFEHADAARATATTTIGARKRR